MGKIMKIWAKSLKSGQHSENVGKDSETQEEIMKLRDKLWIYGQYFENWDKF